MAWLDLPGQPGAFIDYTLTQPQGGTARAVVVYVHGFSSTQLGGGKVPALRARLNALGYAFLAFDHRGHGASSGSLPDMTVTSNIEDLDAMVSHLAGDFDKALLIGSSMGGQTAAWYAAQNPARVTACALIAPGFSFLKDQMGRLGPAQLARLRAEGEIAMQTGGRNGEAGQDCTLGLALYQDLARHPVDELIPRYATPTLIVHGMDDVWVPYEGSVDFAQRSATRPLELLLIAGCDHGLAAHQDVVTGAVCAFFVRVCPPPRPGA